MEENKVYWLAYHFIFKVGSHNTLRYVGVAMDVTVPSYKHLSDALKWNNYVHPSILSTAMKEAKRTYASAAITMENMFFLGVYEDEVQARAAISIIEP